MSLSKTDIIAAYSAVAAVVRMLSGPLTILIVGALLTTEEMGFYYTFYSFVTMAMLFEVGVGYVLKQFYSHEIKLDANGNLAGSSQRSVNHIFRFSLQWYSLVVLVYISSISVLGGFYFSDYVGEIEWQAPFYLLVCASGFRVFLNVYDSYLDGVQYQELVNAIRLLSTLLAAFSLWAAIYLDLGLYSVAIAQLVSGLVIVCIVLLRRAKVFSLLGSEFKEGYSFKAQFSEIFPLFGKTSLVWFFGYFFWNGFTLIAFRVYGAEFAGRIGLSVSIARGGYDVASSFLLNQRTILANQIANNQVDAALKVFRRYFLIAAVVLVSGYGGFLCFQYWLPDFYLFAKLLGPTELLTLFAFFLVTLVTGSLNNFVRAYKIEPFVSMSIYGAIFVPLAFWLGSQFSIDNIFLPSLLVLIVPVYVSVSTFYNKVYRHA